MKVVNLHPGYDAWIRSIKERVQRAFAGACGRHVIVQASLGQLPCKQKGGKL